MAYKNVKISVKVLSFGLNAGSVLLPYRKLKTYIIYVGCKLYLLDF